MTDAAHRPPPGILDPPGSATRTLRGVTRAALDAVLSTFPPATAAYLRETGFAAKPGQVALVPGPAGAESALLGLGDDPSCPWRLPPVPPQGPGPTPGAAAAPIPDRWAGG